MPITEDQARELLDRVRWGDLPEGWKKITEAEFAKSMFFRNLPQATGYRQFNKPDHQARRWLPSRELDGDVPYSAQLFVYHDGTGLAIASDSWAGKVAFFYFGCQHEYRELSVQECRERDIYHAGRCWHVNECQLCGNIDAYDSSD